MSSRKLQVVSRVPSDIDVANFFVPLHISEIAKDLNLNPNNCDLLGKYTAKVLLLVFHELKERQDGYYVVVGGITPTPLGEGKSTTTVGLCQALGAYLDKKIVTTLRQPSQRATFGIKGGAGGGGFSQVIAMDEFNLHMTGDIHTITASNNPLAAATDTRIFNENTQKDSSFQLLMSTKQKRYPHFQRRLKKLNITKTITWLRVMDVNAHSVIHHDPILSGVSFLCLIFDRHEKIDVSHGLSFASSMPNESLKHVSLENLYVCSRPM